jgi:hypothetical protein
MSATLPLSCIADTGDKPCKNEGKYVICVGGMCYSICEDCFKYFGKIHQILLRDYTNSKGWKKTKKGWEGVL